MGTKSFVVALAIFAAIGSALGSTLIEPGRVVLATADGKPRGAPEVRAAIVAGGRKQNWAVVADTPGKLRLQYSKANKHLVIVEALYDEQGYELKYVSSENMDYEVAKDGTAEIHSAYNSWVASLIKAIKQVGVVTPAQASAMIANEALVLQVPAATSQELAASRIGMECRLGETVGAHVSRALSQRYPQLREVQQVETVPAGQLGVRLTIVAASGHAGGSLSGRKSVRLRADLVDSTGVIETRTFLRGSGTLGILGAWRGTCEHLERVGAVLGKDVARWVANPSTPQEAPREESEEAAQAEPAASAVQ